MNQKSIYAPNIMIDIETLGTKPGAGILSIAAIRFDPFTGKTAGTFDMGILQESNFEIGLTQCPETMKWWKKQDPMARERAFSGQYHIYDALLMLFEFFETHDFDANRPWGNSARFDLGILEAAYDKAGIRLPWNPYNEECFRTLCNRAPHIRKEHVFEGLKHSPLADARNQILVTHKLFKHLGFTNN